MNSNILLYTRLHTCKSLVKYLFERIALRTEFLGASEQLHKRILFYLDKDSPNISPPLVQSKLFANIFPRPIIALYGIYLLSNVSYMAIFLAKRIILILSSSVDAAHMPNEYSVSNLHCFILRDMVDCTSLTWNISK